MYTAGGWLNKPWAKGVVLMVFLGYLASSCWGVTFLQEGLEKKRLSRQDQLPKNRCTMGRKIGMMSSFLTLYLAQGLKQHLKEKKE